jgi:hypothetical protein
MEVLFVCQSPGKKIVPKELLWRNEKPDPLDPSDSNRERPNHAVFNKVKFKTFSFLP